MVYRCIRKCIKIGFRLHQKIRQNYYQVPGYVETYVNTFLGETVAVSFTTRKLIEQPRDKHYMPHETVITMVVYDGIGCYD
jgi:hypothetical protein